MHALELSTGYWVLLWPHGYQVEGAGAGGRGDRAEGIQAVGDVGERELELIAAAEGGVDGVEQAVTASNDNRAGVWRHVGAEGRGVSHKFDAGDSASTKIVDKNTGVRGGSDV